MKLTMENKETIVVGKPWKIGKPLLPGQPLHIGKLWLINSTSSTMDEGNDK